ncbi:MAG: hypothetical protein M9938_08430 [Solirubrobacterales bacterium]|nr:hypothetical protein [Solirubrobacterales bacterium]
MNGERAIPELRVTPDRYLPARYAGASGDFNPIHIDGEFATSVGLPGAILHGLYVMSLVARAATDEAGGDPRSLRRLAVQFRGMSFPEQEIVVSGRLAAEGPDDGSELIELEAAQGETRVIRNASATIKRS